MSDLFKEIIEIFAVSQARAEKNLNRIAEALKDFAEDIEDTSKQMLKVISNANDEIENSGQRINVNKWMD